MKALIIYGEIQMAQIKSIVVIFFKSSMLVLCRFNLATKPWFWFAMW